jgi:cell division septation protein DedD
MVVQRARLCIVSREPFPGSYFSTILTSKLGREDGLEIIVDRRRREPSRLSDPTKDRRRRPHVDVALAVNGFAIIAADDQTQSIDRLEADDKDRQRFEDVGSYLHRQPSALIPRLVGALSALTLAALAVWLAGHWNGPSRQSNESPLPVSPTVEESADSAPLSADEVVSTRPDSPRDADRITPRPRETSDASKVPVAASQDAGSAFSQTSAAPSEVRPTPKEPSSSPNRAAPEARSTSSRSGSPPGATTAKAESAKVAGSPRAELVGEPISPGWGDSYAVRLSDPEGRPVVDASVHIVASMADGTIEDIAMGALTEPGTYRGTVPNNHSTSVDLRVRVTTGDGRSVEVPLSR